MVKVYPSLFVQAPGKSISPEDLKKLSSEIKKSRNFLFFDPPTVTLRAVQISDVSKSLRSGQKGLTTGQKHLDAFIRNPTRYLKRVGFSDLESGILVPDLEIRLPPEGIRTLQGLVAQIKKAESKGSGSFSQILVVAQKGFYPPAAALMAGEPFIWGQVEPSERKRILSGLNKTGVSKRERSFFLNSARILS